MLVSIIIPVYNEAKRIEKTVEQVFEYMRLQECRYEILIVDDGSSDDTSTIIKRLQKKYDAVRSVAYHENKGKGYAVRQGMMAAAGEYIFFMDADGSTPVETIDTMLPLLQKGSTDIVVGSRNMHGSKREVTQPLYRRLLGKIGTLLIRLLLLPGITDSQCGFKGFARKAAKDIFSSATVDRWGFDFEILAIGRLRGYRIQEVPVNWLDSAGSRMRPIRGALSTLYELLLVKYGMVRGIYAKKPRK